MRNYSCAILLFPLLLFVPKETSGLIKVEFPVSRIYAESAAVLVGLVSGFNRETRIVDGRITETLKAESVAVPERLRIQIVSPAEAANAVRPDQSFVLFVGGSQEKRLGILHLAGQWLVASPIGERTDAWRVTQRYDAAKSFPGPTTSLIRLLRELKVGRLPIDEEIEPLCLQGPVCELARLPVKDPLFLKPVRLAGVTALLVGTKDGVRAFSGTGRSWREVTEACGLRTAQAQCAAVSDLNGDGRDDLLLGRTLWFGEGNVFRLHCAGLELPLENEWLAVELMEATGDERRDVVLLTKDGRLVLLKNQGPPFQVWRATETRLWEGQIAHAAVFSREWSEDGTASCLLVGPGGVCRYCVGTPNGMPTLLRELTGLDKLDLSGAGDQSLQPEHVLALDFDGNGKLDLMILTRDSGVTMFNRGLGVFLVENSAHLALKPQAPRQLPFTVGSHTRFAAAAGLSGTPPRPNLLVLTEAGVLYEVRHERTEGR